VGLIHSYLNDRHEKMVAELLSERLPHVMVSLSCEVSPQMREYERFNTVVANAYIKPLMKSYLDRLRNRLRSEMVECDVFLMHSGGGIISLESAAEFPVRLVESGPAGGAGFAAPIAARPGGKKVISFDMGGTTAKICLIKDQTPKTSRVFEVARSYRFKKGSGMPISIPVIDMVEIGAGGGDRSRMLMRCVKSGLGRKAPALSRGRPVLAKGEKSRPLPMRTCFWANWIQNALLADLYLLMAQRRKRYWVGFWGHL
jgi:N-methylhydantoinase A